MKMKNTLATTLILGTIGLAAAMVSAGTTATPGPVPFASWDADNDGTVTEQEFNTFREQRQEAMKAGGRMGRNMAGAPTFATIDTDGDGLITAEELTAMQQSMGGNRGMGRHHKGMAQGQMNSNRGMGRGHHGRGQGMTASKGPRYQAMDAETREKHDAFYAATADLRQEMAAKRAEKQAVMRSTNPDPDQAAQLTRELLELRAQMQAQAEEAGIQMAQGRSGRHGGMGHGGNGRW